MCEMHLVDFLRGLERKSLAAASELADEQSKDEKVSDLRQRMSRTVQRHILSLLSPR